MTPLASSTPTSRYLLILVLVPIRIYPILMSSVLLSTQQQQGHEDDRKRPLIRNQPATNQSLNSQSVSLNSLEATA